MQRSPNRPTQSLRKLLEGLTADAPDREVTDLTLDSRAAIPGSVFLAVRGLKNHGLTFAPQAVANGATVVLYEPQPGVPAPHWHSNVTLLPIPDLERRIGHIADRFFSSPSAQMSVIGVTGTNGKTTSAYLIPAALAKLGKQGGYAGTLGYGHIGALKESPHTTADCVTVHRQLATMRDAGDQFVGMEVSSHALDQGRIDGVRVHSALFTNLTRDHLDYHGTLEAYGAAKERLFNRDGLKQCVVNAGDEFGRQLIGRLAAKKSRAPITSYATNEAFKQLGDRQLYATRIEMIAAGLQIAFDGSWGAGRMNSRLIGMFNAENLLGVLAILLGLNIPLLQAVQALEQCAAPPGRMETLSAPGKPLVVVDYAHTPDALGKALQTARAHTNGKLICVFGCGGDRDAGKRPMMGEIAELESDVVIVTDDNPRTEDPDAIVADILQGFDAPSGAIIERDRAKAIARAISMGAAQDFVLIAGKGHEDYQIVGRNVKHFSDREVARKCLELA